MLHHGILSSLCTVLDKYDEDSVRGRVFRIVGNSSDQLLCKTILDKEPEIITKIIKFLTDLARDENLNSEKLTTEATISMAIRVLR